MMYTEKYQANYAELKRILAFNEQKKTMQHNTRETAALLPFQTRNPERVTFNRGFKGILGSFSRKLSQRSFDENIDLEEMIETAVEIVEATEEDKGYLRELLKQYLMNEDNEINILHPHLFLYLKLSEKEQGKGEEMIASFLKDVLFEENEDLKEFFKQKETEHIVLKLILKNIDHFEEDTKAEEKIFTTALAHIPELLKQDISFLMKHQDFLMKNMELICAYYYFFYCSQLIIKLNQGITAQVEQVAPMYFLLDWETASKNRRSIDMGYKYMREESRPLLLHINVLAQLNALLGTKGLLLGQIKQYLEDRPDEAQSYLEIVAQWIKEYRSFNGLEEVETTLDLSSLAKQLYESLVEKIGQASIDRYSKNIEEIGRKYFLKTRGSYGFMLNMTQEMLLVLTALCIKEEKITLNQLFLEYEKRGAFFDRYSKEEIVQLLNQLNLIDKKSDSGDAQYVKSIL